MTSLTKTAIALATVGGVSGVGYVVKQKLTTNDSILDIGIQLIKDDYEPLKEDAAEWEEILQSYKTTIAEKPNLKFGTFDGTGSTNELPKLCSQAIKVNISQKRDAELYEKARMWCTKPKTLEDILGKKGYRFLDTNSNDEKENEEWDKILDKYIKQEQNTKKFTGVNLVVADSGGGVAKKDKTERDKLRKQCEPLKLKKHHTKDFEKELEQVELWCSIKKE